MKRWERLSSALGLSIVLCFGVAACQKKEVTAEEKGPAEKAGQQIDQATVKLGGELNKVAEKAGQGLEKAGEKLQNAARDAENNTGKKP